MRTMLSFLSITILAMINTLFAWKYASRFTDDLTLTAVLAAVFCCPLLIYTVYKSGRVVALQKILNSKKTVPILIAVAIAAAILFFVLYPQERLRIDRYKMIQLFWDNFFSRRCPYCPKIVDTNIPGPFPFYFYAALPFYLIGEEGLFSLAGFLLFSGILLTAKEFTTRLKSSILLLLITSPAFMYELFCRSTNFLNSSLLLFGTLILCRAKTGSRRYLLYAGVITGLVVSTRSFAFMIVLIAVVFTFKKTLISRKVITVSLTAVGVFLLTFVPVIALCGKSFLQYNPFIVQASLAPPFIVVTISFAACLWAYQSRSIITLSTINGFVLALFAAAYSVDFIASHGLYKSIFCINGVDISYFSLALPFLLYGIGDNRERVDSGRENQAYM